MFCSKEIEKPQLKDDYSKNNIAETKWIFYTYVVILLRLEQSETMQ